MGRSPGADGGKSASPTASIGAAGGYIDGSRRAAVLACTDQATNAEKARAQGRIQMTALHTPRRSDLAAALLALAAIPLLLAAPATAAKAPKVTVNKPRVSTSGAHRLAGSSAVLGGVVIPKGNPTSYYFQWGPTTAYGSQTPTVSVPASSSPKVKVGQTVTGLRPSVTYHFRIVGVYTVGGQPQPPIYGRDRTFAIKGQLQFDIPKIAPVPVGTPFIFSGVLGGVGAANHPVILQASPYPYTSPFTAIGIPGLTNFTGRFAFRVANLSSSTAFRVLAVGTRPVYSPVVSVSAAARVTLRVRRSSVPGLVRLYGTVTPSAVGAPLVIQFRKPIKLNRPSKSEATTRFVSATFTRVKKGVKTYSRFSVVLKVRDTGRYRAFVKLPKGPVVSGASSTVVLHAAPASKSKTKH
jgi:hypothetical protein